jgi:predicted ABC-type ATPase
LDLLASLSDVRASLLGDCRIQIRLETHIPQEFDQVARAVADYGVDYVVFNNHLPEALDMAQNAPHRFASWAAQTKRTADEMLQIVQAAEASGAEVPRALGALAAQFTANGVRMGSHDDGTAEVRSFFRQIGAPICEFPTTVQAAAAARAAGEPVLMGAPNVVRGGSQSGNIAAQDLIAAGFAPFNPESASIKAARLMLKEIDACVAKGESFAFETTLSGLAYLGKIESWQRLGYQIKLWFLSLPNDDIAVQRVASRVAQGGHNIPERVIRRRFKAGLHNFHTRYSKVVDSWTLFDSYVNPPKPIDWGNK